MVSSINPSSNPPYIPPDQQKTTHTHQQQAPGSTTHSAETSETPNSTAIQPMQLIQDIHKGGGHKKGAADKIDGIQPLAAKKLSRAQMRYTSAEATKRQAMKDLKKLEKEKKALLKRKEKEDQKNKEQKKSK